MTAFAVPQTLPRQTLRPPTYTATEIQLANQKIMVVSSTAIDEYRFVYAAKYLAAKVLYGSEMSSVRTAVNVVNTRQCGGEPIPMWVLKNEITVEERIIIRSARRV